MKLQAIFLCLLATSNSVYATDQERVTLYGFFDTEVEVSNSDDERNLWTFDQHNLNIIAIYKMDRSFRVFSEVEYEHAAFIQNENSTGKIYLARSYLEYKRSDAFRVRIGKFLTPFGIYNERHDATPTFLFAKAPPAVYGNLSQSGVGVGDGLFAKASTGIQLLGTILTHGWEGKYYVGISNGRGPNPDERDNNANKGLSARLIITPPIGDNWRIGTSYYADRDGLSNNSRKRSIGFDLEAEEGNLVLNAEMVLWRYDHVENPDGPIEKYTGLSYYLLGGYTFFERLTPFLTFDHLDKDSHYSTDNPEVFRFGVNYALTNKVFLKAEALNHRFNDSGRKKFITLIASIAAAL